MDQKEKGMDGNSAVPDPFRGTAEILETEVAKKAYDDALSSPIKEASGMATDILKGLRLFTAPFAMMANFRERLLETLEECRQKVPVERQVECPPEIAGPVIEKLRFLAPENELRQLFLNLLSASIDRERQSKAHPSFVNIIGQLSRDEALLLKAIAHWGGPAYHGVVIELSWFGIEFDGDRIDVEVRHKGYLPESELAFKDRLYVYLTHLETLNLIKLQQQNTASGADPKRKAPVETFLWAWQEEKLLVLTPFGDLFTQAVFGEQSRPLHAGVEKDGTLIPPNPFHRRVYDEVMDVARRVGVPVITDEKLDPRRVAICVSVYGRHSCCVSVQPARNRAMAEDVAKRLNDLFVGNAYRVAQCETDIDTGETVFVVTPRSIVTDEKWNSPTANP